MKNTGIQWCDDTVNPTSGCDGCELWVPDVGGPCYAGNFHQKRLALSLPHLYSPNFRDVRTIPGRIAKMIRCMDLQGIDRAEKPWLNGLRRKIFVGDLGDIFSRDVPFEYLKSEIIDLATTKAGVRHDLQLLTKQPKRAAAFSDWLRDQGCAWPDNVWIGTSITSNVKLGRIEALRGVAAKHRFLSLEPLIGPVELAGRLEGFDWLIVGGESDQDEFRGRDFHVEWALDIITVGKSESVAVFVKQLGSHPFANNMPLALQDHHGGNWLEWNAQLRVRQMPFGSR